MQFGGKDQLGDEPLGHGPLFHAARLNHTRVLQLLLEKGADPNRQDYLGQTPLLWAAEAGHLESVRLLLQPDPKALFAALENRQAECAALLLAAGSPPDQKCLVQAAYMADAELLRKMLELKPRLKPDKALEALAYATRRVPADQAPPGRWTTIWNDHGCFKDVPEPPERVEAARQVLLAAGAQLPKPKAQTQPRKKSKDLPQPTYNHMPDLSQLEAALGTRATQPDYLRGGREFAIPQPIDLAQLRSQHPGIYLFHPGDSEKLAAIPADWREAIALMQTNGANCDILPGDLLQWLEKLNETQPFQLTSIGHDRLEGVFLTPIARPQQLARSMYKICPDIVDQGCGSLQVLTEELQKVPAQLYFWWD
ncbi:hypothetical protein ABS71_17225 [bacterium SCN 62-11]|nr:MAG: hypothetical protein ABS71_17225 [bacterium SCN 62-11]